MELRRAAQNILHHVIPSNPECLVSGTPPTVITKGRPQVYRLCQSRMRQVPVSSCTQPHMKNNFPLPPLYEQWSWWCQSKISSWNVHLNNCLTDWHELYVSDFFQYMVLLI
ncbi:hypothetical protein M9H77_02508 [Catharanthus roseus]|uniref:Uncharacterized protein n=1 Tax=Catharanthus roseus TaxID=4058 RepID=A0ACC0C944_CATRO|nr:hypothetical protein M9H77_02508 [Catharanthus roseus]